MAGSELCNQLLVPSVGIYVGFAVLGLLFTILICLAVACVRPRWGYAIPAVLAPLILVGFIVNSRLPYFSPKATKQYAIEKKPSSVGTVSCLSSRTNKAHAES